MGQRKLGRRSSRSSDEGDLVGFRPPKNELVSRPRERTGAQREEEELMAMPSLGTATATRLSVNLSREVAEALAAIARKHGSTITDAVRRSISTQRYIEDALDRGAKILIAEKGEPPRELVFM
jgi:hypothetical protein